MYGQGWKDALKRARDRAAQAATAAASGKTAQPTPAPSATQSPTGTANPEGHAGAQSAPGTPAVPSAWSYCVGSVMETKPGKRPGLVSSQPTQTYISRIFFGPYDSLSMVSANEFAEFVSTTYHVTLTTGYISCRQKAATENRATINRNVDIKNAKENPQVPLIEVNWTPASTGISEPAQTPTEAKAPPTQGPLPPAPVDRNGRSFVYTYCTAMRGDAQYVSPVYSVAQADATLARQQWQRYLADHYGKRGEDQVVSCANNMPTKDLAESRRDEWVSKTSTPRNHLTQTDFTWNREEDTAYRRTVVPMASTPAAAPATTNASSGGPTVNSLVAKEHEQAGPYCENNVFLNATEKCSCFADQMTAARAEHPGVIGHAQKNPRLAQPDFMLLITMAHLESCTDPVKLREYVHGRALQNVSNTKPIEARATKANCVADGVTKDFVAKPVVNMSYLDGIYSKNLMSCSSAK